MRITGATALLIGTLCAGTAAAQTTSATASVTILSSNLADGATVGEWGLSALVETDGRCVLFDTGRNPDTVLRNAETLGVDLGCVEDIVLSHFHFDHTTGLGPILGALGASSVSPVRVHVADGFFLPRRGRAGPIRSNQMIEERAALEAAGARFLVHDGPTEIAPAVWVSGPVERPLPERNYGAGTEVQLDGEWVEDYVPESQALTVVTDEGHIVLLGCGHSGTVNALDQIRSEIAELPILALMGGLHLFNATDETLGWTADRLREIGVEHLMAGHCTGIEPLFRLRAGLNLSRQTAVVGSVGSRFVLGEGIRPGRISM